MAIINLDYKELIYRKRSIRSWIKRELSLGSPLVRTYLHVKAVLTGQEVTPIASDAITVPTAKVLCMRLNIWNHIYYHSRTRSYKRDVHFFST